MEKHPLHFKIRRNILKKFLSEPVDALDLRLTKDETLLDGKVKRDDEGDHEASGTTVTDVRDTKDEPLDTQDSHDDQVTSSRGDDLEGHSDAKDDHPDTDIQFIRASSLKSFENQLIIQGNNPLPPQARVNILHKNITNIFQGTDLPEQRYNNKTKYFRLRLYDEVS